MDDEYNIDTGVNVRIPAADFFFLFIVIFLIVLAACTVVALIWSVA